MAEFETRRHPGVQNVVHNFGRSYGWVMCPFCCAGVKVFIWSLAGSGKRCACGAKIEMVDAKKAVV